MTITIRLALLANFSLLWLFGVPTATAQTTLAHTKKPAKPLFLAVQKTQFFLGTLPYRNIGVNIPDLFTRFLEGHDASAVQALTQARNSGVLFARCAGTAERADVFATFTQSPDRWFDAFDRMLAAADSLHMMLVPSLLYDAHVLPDYTGKNESRPDTIAEYLTPGSASNALAVRYVTAIVTRYRQDPRILFWEIGDAYNRLPESDATVTADQVSAFLRQMAVLIHKLDRKHLVASGSGRPAPTAWHQRQAKAGHPAGIALADPSGAVKDTLEQYGEMVRLYNPPEIDIACTQEDPIAPTPLWVEPNTQHAFVLPWTQYVASQIGKPLFVCRFAQQTQAKGQEQAQPWTFDFLRRMQNEGAPLSALWTWEPEAPEAAAAAFAWSPTQTPTLVNALAVTNDAIARAIITGPPVALAPPLAVTVNQELADKMRVQNQTLHAIAVNTLASARLLPEAGSVAPNKEHANGTGETLHLPRADAPTFRVRDAAWMLGGDLIAASEVEGWAKLLAARQAGAKGVVLNDGRTVPAGSIPDQLLPRDGSALWFPPESATATGSVSNALGLPALPPADTPYYFIEMVYEHFRLTHKPTLFRSNVVTPTGAISFTTACIQAFDSVAAQANGLVVCEAPAGKGRADWGFSDRVRKSGFCLMPSLLRYRAARRLSELYRASGDSATAIRYDSEADKIRTAIVQVFYLSLVKVEGRETGCLLSATEQGRKDDIWGEAFAVWLNVLPAAQSQAVALHLRALYRTGGLVADGQIRSLPPDGDLGRFWEQSDDAPGTGENGAFWGLPVGWFVAALSRVDRAAGAQVLSDYVNSLQTRRDAGAPWECVNPAANYTLNPLTCVSVTVPTIALRASEPATP